LVKGSNYFNKTKDKYYYEIIKFRENKCSIYNSFKKINMNYNYIE